MPVCRGKRPKLVDNDANAKFLFRNLPKLRLVTFINIREEEKREEFTRDVLKLF